MQLDCDVFLLILALNRFVPFLSPTVNVFPDAAISYQGKVGLMQGKNKGRLSQFSSMEVYEGASSPSSSRGPLCWHLAVLGASLS